MWQTMLVIAQNLVWRSRVQDWHLIYPSQDVLQLGLHGLFSTIGVEPFEPFFKRFLDCTSKRFAGSCGQFSSQPLDR